MPKIVEIIGPSGSGKSSVYKLLKQKWTPGYNWVPYEQLQASNETAYTRIITKGLRVWKQLSPFSKVKPRETQIKPEWKVIKKYNDVFLGEEYSDFKSVLMDLVEDHCKTGYTGIDKRFITVYMVMWSIAYIETIKSFNNDDRYCILNQGEGLISRIMHLNSPTFDENALRKYLEAAPHPDLLILLQVDDQEILRRVKTRKRSSSLHDGMDEQTILEYTKKTNKLLFQATNILEKSDVVVDRIDASSDLDQVVGQIIKKLSANKT